jgi:small-conductance mechanosensitive channel
MSAVASTNSLPPSISISRSLIEKVDEADEADEAEEADEVDEKEEALELDEDKLHDTDDSVSSESHSEQESEYEVVPAIMKIRKIIQ